MRPMLKYTTEYTTECGRGAVARMRRDRYPRSRWRGAASYSPAAPVFSFSYCSLSAGNSTTTMPPFRGSKAYSW